MKLERAGCLTVDDDLFGISPTVIGNLASYYYTKHETLEMYVKSIHSGLTMIEIAKILSNATEFLEVPVRHNEDNYNEALN